MSDPIRVLHFADVHIGMENYGKTDPNSGVSSRVVDFLHRMDDVVKYAREQDADLIIFAGDAFKTRAPSPTFQREFAHRVRELAELAPTVLLVGNHDLPINALKASTIEIYDTLAVPNVWVAQEFEVRAVETKRGQVIVGTAPYPIRARMLTDTNTRGMTVSEQDAKLSTILHQVLDDMAKDADELAGDDVPRLLTGHFTVAGAIWGSERSVMLGRDVQMDLGSLADPRWDYVALGHIHKHQNLTHQREGVPPVVYSGSIERIDFGEEGDPKGFCWVELERHRTNWEFIPVDARPMVTLRVDCKKTNNPTLKVVEHIKKHLLVDAVVRLVIELSPETETQLNENGVQDALRRAGVFSVAGIRKDVERPNRARLGGSPEGLTHMELLERYLISREISPARRDELLDKAREIIEPK